MAAIIVTNNPKNLTFSIPGVEIVQAKDYLISPKFRDARGLKVFNMCRSYGYQTDGYYVSLLFLALGFFWIALPPRKQGWHDKLAGTVVVRRRRAVDPTP